MGLPDRTPGARLSRPTRAGRAAWPGPVAALLSGLLHVVLAAVLLPTGMHPLRPPAATELLMVMVRPAATVAPAPSLPLAPTTIVPTAMTPAHARPVLHQAPTRARLAQSAPRPLPPVPTPPNRASTAPWAPTAAPAPAIPVAPPRPVAGLAGNLPPLYPISARRRHDQGRVLLRVDVAPDGTATGLRVLRSSGSPVLDEAALEAVRLWRFVPARLADRAVAATADVPISFRLEN